jgi:signal peptidase I
MTSDADASASDAAPTAGHRDAASSQSTPAAPAALGTEPVEGDASDARTGGRPGDGKKSAHSWRGLLRELVIVVVGALIVSSLLRAFVGQMFIIPSESMENTLLVGDRVVVEKLTGYERGDVVVFTDPGGWLSEGGEEPSAMDRVLEFVGFPTANSPGHLIKRVIGLPGDHVVCCDKQRRITVNGQPLDEKSYLYTDPDGEQVQPSATTFDVVVPAGRIWVMGDHRNMSADSRCHLTDISTQGTGQTAFVPEDYVVGPTIAVAWPPSRGTRLHRPATFDSIPAPAQPAPQRAVVRPGGREC